ncbi:ligase-associated DNA damage response endonuclease PdeM [Lutimaribacter marinistellae]|uniref:Ligase-associated DNA damage response endonuclease PdeM n=1 Tax=Lutimaribacter marinistellae TaxID=1820329 RepID=A0ABV7TFW4_9RHOB
MNGYDFSLAGVDLTALGSGALWWREADLLCVSDLHLGKSERIARRGGTTLPPYETRDTLNRLSDDLEKTDAKTVICLGDNFDDLHAAEALTEHDRTSITVLQSGRQWLWIEGNHDPGPVEFGGAHLAEYSRDGLTFRHIAQSGAQAEISGHYHPKATLRSRGRAISRAAFLVDDARVILPAYGTYTGGLRCDDAALCALMGPRSVAILTGPTPAPMPMPR